MVTKYHFHLSWTFFPNVLVELAKLWFAMKKNLSMHVFCIEHTLITRKSQCPRLDLKKRFLPRPNTTTAWKFIPHRSKISKNWNPPLWVPLHRFYKNSSTVITFKLILLRKKFPMCRILILADIRPMGYRLSCCGSLWSR